MTFVFSDELIRSELMPLGFLLRKILHLANAVVLSMLSSFLAASFASAEENKPVNRYGSESIFLGQYSRYESHGTVNFSNPPVAVFHNIRVIKGPPCGRGEMFIRYEFTEKDCQKEPKNWTFSESTLPEKGSWWIVFATYSSGNGWRTFKGSAGRVKYSRKNLDEVLDGLQAASGVQFASPAYRENLYSEIERAPSKQ
jgi:hypothetical protein